MRERDGEVLEARDDGPRLLDDGLGALVEVAVVEVSCSGRVREPVYPPLLIADTTIATASSAYRTVRGRRAGTTRLTVRGDEPTLRADVDVIVR